MGEKRNALVTIGLISAIILILTVADFMHEDRLFSDTENRVLASKPTFSAQALFEGDYTQKYETYVTDQFVSRDKWIGMNTYMDIVLQKQEIGGVYLGAEGYLIEQHLPEKYTQEQETKRLDLLEKLVDRWDAMVMLVPTADNILMEQMPANAPYYDEAAFLAQAEERIGSEHMVDVYTMMQEHAGEEIYYRTDHHWTSLGAYYGYLAWAEAMGISAQDYDVNGMETAADDFLGTLHSKVNLEMSGEKMQFFPETTSRPVKVTYDLKNTTDSLYERTHLDTKNKYAFFMDDNHAFVEIETGYHNGKVLFVLKDSYANCFVPLLLPHYEKIYVMDLRYFNGRLYGFMEKYEPEEGMDVLVLYNCIHFLEGFSYMQ
ncbi:MAG: hypothetical protein HFH82_01025 [Lachnospiraceae bacterium]|nr:hypothetical protein [Lachnospiraceae bacterium]